MVPRPRMLMVVFLWLTENAVTLADSRVKLARLMGPFLSRASPLSTCSASGTSCTASLRRRAVTMTAPSSASSATIAAAGGALSGGAVTWLGGGTTTASAGAAEGSGATAGGGSYTATDASG